MKKEKKEEKIKKQEVPAEEKPKKKDNQLYWILGAMAVLVVVFFISYSIFSNINKVEFNGLTFTKEMFGEIPVFHNYYNFMSNGELFQYNLYLRNDPRKNKVPITGNAIDDGIEFSQENYIYISLAPDALVGCEYGSVGLSSLASFLADNQLNIKGAAADEELARQNNVAYANCETHPDDSVIVVKNGDETRIVHDKKNCYIIDVANCEIIPAVEKFQIQSILDARERKEVEN